MPEQRSSSGASPRHERSPFIPDELLPWFEPVTTGRATLEFPQSGGVSDVTTADVRRMSGGCQAEDWSDVGVTSGAYAAFRSNDFTSPPT